jgi:hypothetical protein
VLQVRVARLDEAKETRLFPIEASSFTSSPSKHTDHPPTTSSSLAFCVGVSLFNL